MNNIIDNKIKQYEDLRTKIYKLIDITHYSPDNLKHFNTLHEISIRLDELFQLKNKLN